MKKQKKIVNQCTILCYRRNKSNVMDIQKKNNAISTKFLHRINKKKSEIN